MLFAAQRKEANNTQEKIVFEEDPVPWNEIRLINLQQTINFGIPTSIVFKIRLSHILNRTFFSPQ